MGVKSEVRRILECGTDEDVIRELRIVQKHVGCGSIVWLESTGGSMSGTRPRTIGICAVGIQPESIFLSKAVSLSEWKGCVGGVQTLNGI